MLAVLFLTQYVCSTCNVPLPSTTGCRCVCVCVCVCVYARACMCIQHPPPSLPPSLPLSFPPSAEKALVWTCCWSSRLTASATCSSTMPHSPRGPCSCNKTGLTTDCGDNREGLSGQDRMGPSGIIPPVTATVYIATHQVLHYYDIYSIIAKISKNNTLHENRLTCSDVRVTTNDVTAVLSLTPTLVHVH